MVFFNPIGDEGEDLATRAADAVDAAAGLDPEFGTVTIDGDGTDEELQERVFAALDELDADWRTQLELTD
jgi:hypothetical protein